MVSLPVLEYRIPILDRITKVYKNVFDVISINDFWITKENIKVISYAGWKKIASFESIVMKSEPKVLASPTEYNKQQHWIGAWFGISINKVRDFFANSSLEDDRDAWQWADGEASVLNTGKYSRNKDGKIEYKEINEVDSMYRGAMAQKRMFVRGVQNFIEFKDGKVFSDIEADAFKKTNTVEQAVSSSFNTTIKQPSTQFTNTISGGTISQDFDF